MAAELAMDVLAPATLAEALGMKRDRPDAVVICGGTDVMVAMNFDRIRPAAMLDVSRLAELQEWRREGDHLFLGAGVSYARIVRELPEFTPLVQASRTVGSPQIRNRGTVGGNLGTSSPAGDALPVLAAYDAEVVLASAGRGERALPWNRFLTGPKANAMAPDELILGTRWRITTGPGSFSKIGTRNAMVIAVASLCLVLDEDTRTVRAALGSVGPTIIRAGEAEAFENDVVPWGDGAGTVDAEAIERFAELVADAAAPIDDVRGTAAYRRHASRVLAGRALTWALAERPSPGTP
jgi:CO/xanthine dehydrogenase FAD-binding subunit